jgi:hypothetical protein
MTCAGPPLSPQSSVSLRLSKLDGGMAAARALPLGPVKLFNP